MPPHFVKNTYIIYREILLLSTQVLLPHTCSDYIPEDAGVEVIQPTHA